MVGVDQFYTGCVFGALHLLGHINQVCNQPAAAEIALLVVANIMMVVQQVLNGTCHSVILLHCCGY